MHPGQSVSTPPVSASGDDKHKLRTTFEHVRLVRRTQQPARSAVPSPRTLRSAGSVRLEPEHARPGPGCELYRSHRANSRNSCSRSGLGGHRDQCCSRLEARHVSRLRRAPEPAPVARRSLRFLRREPWHRHRGQVSDTILRSLLVSDGKT
ncbi:hypothetical protein C8T65DRAFT_285073 [Cerioporus squamosus]|nr:hypothetical protein C8T65DRAFT_285073 [Cerioporus squamosus]